MDIDITTLRIVATIACFATFLCILVFACARRNGPAFEAAAALPFTGEVEGELDIDIPRRALT